MFVLGLTGGIGSGKSAAAQAFADLGAFVVNADAEAKRLMQEDPALVAAIREAFGAESYDAGGRLNRPYLAARVFGDREEVERLNALVHPRVKAHFPRLLDRAEAAGAALLVYEAALIFEAGTGDRFDAVAVVDAPAETRIERVMRRDGVPREAVLARMRHQLPPDELRRRADYLLVNDGDLAHLHAQVETLYRQLTA
ncbi:MAG: dephospho-CoA kinase [Rhodothermales bacterium]|nr:dephospho-CoA kinase [Rhodothermales bacterium]